MPEANATLIFGFTVTFVPQSRKLSCRTVDLAIIAAYLAGVTWFGAQFREKQHSLKDYFLGGQTAPWWAIALSIVSAETSTLTIIGTPPLAYSGSYVFLQVVFGYLLARLVISTIFLPRYFEHQIFTAYELMERRFGPRVRKVASIIFMVTRALAEGVRVFAISIVISIILKTGGTVSIVVIIALTLFYTFEGGMTAVIWTDVIQMGMYVVGALVSFFILVGKIPGGFSHAWDVASAAGKLQVFDFHWSWTKPYTIWAGIIGGCFLTTASHGTDQLVVQRLLSAKNQSQSRAALFSSWIVIFIQFSLFLTIGMLLWVYRGGAPAPAHPDQLYPAFIWQSLPVGVAGLAMAAIIAAAMANLAAALNSLASATVIDIYLPLNHLRRNPAFPENSPLLHDFLGPGFRRNRPRGKPVGIGAGERPEHRVSNPRYPVGIIPAGRPHQQTGRKCGGSRSDCRSRGDDVREIRNKYSIHLVGGDRKRGDIRRGLRHISFSYDQRTAA